MGDQRLDTSTIHPLTPDQVHRARLTAARNATSRADLNQLLDMLGLLDDRLTRPDTEPRPEPHPAPVTGGSHVSQPDRRGHRVLPVARPATEHDRTWRDRAICRDEDPELFFAVGNSGPALLQIADAKTVCRRCPVVSDCLAWALDTGQESGVAGGLSEDERRALKRNVRAQARSNV
jgi:WhiB family redox-sensing transcriptional regulator